MSLYISYIYIYIHSICLLYQYDQLPICIIWQFSIAMEAMDFPGFQAEQPGGASVDAGRQRDRGTWKRCDDP